MPGWVLRAGCVALTAALPLVLGVPAALVLLLMPVAVECSREAGERLTCAAAVAALGAACCIVLPQAAVIPVLLWCGAGVAMCLIRRGHSLKRGLAWAGICTALLCGVLVWLGMRYGGQIFAGLAEDITDWINRREDAGDILLQCYQMGFSRLEDDMQPVLSLFGMLVMTQEIRLQLLYSLRTTLEMLLQALLPQWIVAWVMFTAVLSAAVPDVVRRRRGLHGRLEPFGRWQMTEAVRRHLNVLVLGYFLQLFTDDPVLVLLGSLCAAAFQYAYIILGLAVMEGMTKKFGTMRLLRRVWMAGCILFAPFVLVILGIVDRMFDLRRLSRSTDDEGGFEQ